MGQRYTVSRLNVTGTAGNDLITGISAANRRIRLISVNVIGRGSSSAPQGVHLGRGATGTTPGGAITPDKAEHVDQPAATFTTATTWAAQPTLQTNPIPVGWNALGGINRWTTEPGRPQGMLEARNGEVISIRCGASFTPQACDISATFEED